MSVDSFLKQYGIPNIIDIKVEISKESWKRKVKCAIRLKSEERIKKEMIGYSKLKEIGASKEGLEVREGFKKNKVTNLGHCPKFVYPLPPL